MSYSQYIRGIKWYYCLIPKDNTRALFTDYKRENLQKKLLIAWDYFDGIKQRKLYAVFDDHFDFAKYFLLTSDHLKCFYELILGEAMQKPHFDLDMELSIDEINEQKDIKILNELIVNIIDVLKQKNINLILEKDICIYSSHGDTKRSYHIINS